MQGWDRQGQCHRGDVGVGSHRMNRSSPAGELEKEGCIESERHGERDQRWETAQHGLGLGSGWCG